MLRNEFIDEPIVKELAQKKNQNEFDEYLLGLFKVSGSELFEQISPDVAKMVGLKRDHFGHEVVNVPLKYKRMRIEHGNIFAPTKTFTKNNTGPYSKYLSDKKDLDYNNYVNYIEDIPLISFPKWKFERKPHLAHILRPINTLYTQWSDFMPRRPKQIKHEQHICVLHGKETFRIVSPIFRKNIYVGDYEHVYNYESPVDFFKPNYDRFPYLKQFKFIEVELNAGDCMYVPAYFYI